MTADVDYYSPGVMDVLPYHCARRCVIKDPGSNPGEFSICISKFLANW